MFKMDFIEILKSKNAKIGIGILLVIGFSFFLLRKNPKPVEISLVTKGTYQQILSVQGKSKVKELYTVYSPVNGVMRRVELHAGDQVKKGMTLLTVDWDIVKTVKANTNGQILKVYRESAGPVAMGERIIDYGDLSKLEIIAYVLTEDMPDLTLEDPVNLSGFGEQILKGKIANIEPAAITKVSSLGVEEQRVPISIAFDPPSGMGDGYELECKIILFEKPNSILIPSSALFRQDDKWAVYTVEKKKATLRFVTVEHQSEGMSLIQDGLQEGESIILYPGDGISNGTKVVAE
ncbi:efflux RND transporter periplasmic adaptor subunit [Leptospira kemamanensis]|uniref:Efflux RND transporter periplasmic adaptor subunit n=1 Tax=Leptospira kemamanensis TaxID=2484942 RepID=A0A4R9JVN0_9LEPT|nr:efflux RND transporter periplasmic adaptor subunit [Leptospira kemamanensis]TGL57013.1 efflux RND transporter periplasmic adaptor subunit [Leptospira kemamanensis]